MRQATAIGLALAVVMGAGQAVQAALPDDASSAYEDALASFNDDDYNTAIIHLKNALKLDPRNLSARVLLGRTYLAMGAGQLAENEFKKARQQGGGRRLHPGSAGSVLSDAGRAREAVPRGAAGRPQPEARS